MRAIDGFHRLLIYTYHRREFRHRITDVECRLPTAAQQNVLRHPIIIISLF
jgi:hypothetical protein